MPYVGCDTGGFVGGNTLHTPTLTSILALALFGYVAGNTLHTQTLRLALIGFVGGNTSSELLARWYWSSAFMSLMRVHSTMNYDSTGHGGGIPVIPHFPWLYGAAAAIAMRKALEMRYMLIPMLYSLGHQGYASGAPIMRPLLMHFGSDPATAQITDQWLVGEGLMTAPVLVPKVMTAPVLATKVMTAPVLAPRYSEAEPYLVSPPS